LPIAAAAVVVLVGGQFVVPPIANVVLRHRLGKDGKVVSAHLSAFPWVKLILQHADTVTATMVNYDVKPSQLESLLHEAKGIDTLRISIGVVHTGLLTLHDVSFTKHGNEMVGVANLDLADLRSALPIIKSLTPVQSSDGHLTLRGTASVLGVNASVDVAVSASDGKLVVAPTGLFGAFATVTLYDDPQIYVQSVTAEPIPGGLRFITRGTVK
jgi:hypothetical protein